MSTTLKADVAIIGAGIAGLSLATRLKQENPSSHVTLVGPEDLRPQRISTWIESNNTVPAFVKSCIDKQWDAWRFRDKFGNVYTQLADTTYYAAIDGKRLKEQLEEHATLLGIQRIKERCDSVKNASTGYQFICKDHRAVSTQLVDTRPPAIPSTTIKQQFVGRIIRCDNPHEHTMPQLMDFTARPIANDGLTFVYTLPLSDRDLLIEATTFSPTLYAQADYEACIGQWIENHLAPNNAWKHIETESGILPMGPVAPADGTLARCGIAGGSSRASTGYAWHGTQRQITQLAKAFALGADLTTEQVYSYRARFMDTLFLRVLQQQPEAIYQLFMVMAKRLPGDTLAHFLCDEDGWRPCLRTILTAPKWPFIRALWQA